MYDYAKEMRFLIFAGLALQISLLIVGVSQGQQNYLNSCNFDNGFDGWDLTGTFVPWAGYTLETDNKWYGQWAGARGVIVLDAGNLPRRGIDASAGIQKTIELPNNAKYIEFDVVKLDHDGGFRATLTGPDGERKVLGEQILQGGDMRTLTYDVSQWAGETVTLGGWAFAAGIDATGCDSDAGKCCWEYIGIDSIKIIGTATESASSDVTHYNSSIAIASNLTGDWSCSLGGDYYIRQQGNNIMWYGEAAAINPYFSNVAYGWIDGNIISLTWVDVPKGTNSASGSLKLIVLSNEDINILEQTGGWGGNYWRDFRLTRKTYGF